MKWHSDFYEDTHATPKDVILLIEVSASTLREDRMVKIPLYARASIPEVWIVNLKESIVEVYSDVESGHYKGFKRGGPEEALRLPGGLQGEFVVGSILSQKKRYSLCLLGPLHVLINKRQELRSDPGIPGGCTEQVILSPHGHESNIYPSVLHEGGASL